MNKIMTVSLMLALVAAAGYFLMATGVIHPGDLTGKDAPPGIVWVAGACYVIGGVFILWKRRGLLIAGAAVNALVIVMFIAMYAGKPSVMFSAPGLMTKIAQILLEAGLIYIIVKFRPQLTTAPPK